MNVSRLLWVIFAVLAAAPVGAWVYSLGTSAGAPLPPPLPAPEKPAYAEAFLGEAAPLLARFDGHARFHVREPSLGLSFGLEDDVPVYLASGLKLFVLIEAHRQLATGALERDERIWYRRKDVRDGAPAMNKRKRGRAYSVEDLLQIMIRDSDNAATDLLLGRLGRENVRALIERLSPDDEVGEVVPMIDVRREVYSTLDPGARRLDAVQIRDIGWHPGFDPSLWHLKKHVREVTGRAPRDFDKSDMHAAFVAYYELKRNSATLRAAGEALSRLANDTMIDPEHDAEIKRALFNVWTCACRIDGVLEGDEVDTRVAHKTGTQHERVVDLALIEQHAGRPFVFTIAVEGEREAAEGLIRDLTRALLRARRSSTPHSRHPPGELN